MMGNLEEKKILGFEGLFDKFISLYLKKNLPNKLIISGQKGIGKSSFSKKFINFILSKNLTNDYDTMNNTPVFLNKYSNQNYFHQAHHEQGQLVYPPYTNLSEHMKHFDRRLYSNEQAVHCWSYPRFENHSR